MCPVEEVASCQLSFVPIQSKDYLADVERVLDLIKTYELEYCIGEMSTVIKGSKAKIMELISRVYDLMSPKCGFILDIRLSNICGCRGKM